MRPAARPALQRLELWTLLAGAFLLPLAYTPNTYDGYVLPKLLLARVLVLSLVAWRLARFAAEGSARVRRSPLDVPILAGLGSATLSTLLAYNVNVAVFGTYSRYDGLLTALTYAALFWLALQVLETREDARALLRVLLAAGYVASAVAILRCVGESVAAGRLVPAFGTLGQKNVLGAFLALLLPIAYAELATSKGWIGRFLALNVLAMIGLAVALSFSRSAWVAAVAAALLVVAALRKTAPRRALLAAAAMTVVLAGVVLAVGLDAPPQRQDLLEAGDRPLVWSDTMKLIASRPLEGYGPDNFGLVFPTFQSADLHQQWDKAHAELLQIAATQGLIGIATYAWLLTAIAIAFWKGERSPHAWGVVAGLAAYEAVLQLNFTALAAAFPFWLVAAAAMTVFGSARDARTRAIRAPAMGLVAAGACATAAIFTTLPVYAADAELRAAVDADFSGNSAGALAPAGAATSLQPFESVYATEVGNIAFERGDWQAARIAYLAAARLGTFNPAVYRNLALADQHLGLYGEGRQAARRAVELNRFDPANVALLAQFGGAP